MQAYDKNNNSPTSVNKKGGEIGLLGFYGLYMEGLLTKSI